MLTTAESQALIGIVDNRNVPYATLNDEWKVAIDALTLKHMVEVKDGLVNASAQGVTLVKIFKSGLDFSIMYKRLPFRIITKLLHLGFNKCFEDGIHLNVIFKNMPDEQLQIIEKEIEIARQAKT
jgi:hypothetical protein